MDGFRVYVDQVEEKIYVYIPMFECFLLFFLLSNADEWNDSLACC